MVSSNITYHTLTVTLQVVAHDHILGNADFVVHVARNHGSEMLPSTPALIDCRGTLCGVQMAGGVMLISVSSAEGNGYFFII